MRTPDRTGGAGRAWLVPLQNGWIATWLVNRPGAHPFWQWWLVCVNHLRDTEGLRPAVKHYPEAEYEFLIVALDPTECPNPDPDHFEKFRFLSPSDVVEQFHGVSDADAERLCDSAVTVILSGQVSPDQDHRSLWKAIIAGTVRHLAEGRHPVS